MAAPLECGQGTLGGKQIPLLDANWCADIEFLEYLPWSGQQDAASVDQRTDALAMIADDISLLLALPYNCFWSQVVFDKSLHRFLDSFLRHTYRYYDYDALATLSDDCIKLEQSLQQKVFYVLLRMSTHKESADNFITPEAYGQLLYDNWLFDIPRMLDMAAVYGRRNQPLLKKMLSNIFQHAPQYQHDLGECLHALVRHFHSICQQYGLLDGMEATLQSTTGEAAADLLRFVMDTLASLSAFASCYSSWRDEAIDAQIVVSLTMLVSNIVEHLERRCAIDHTETDPDQLLLQGMYIKLQEDGVKHFRVLLSVLYVTPLVENKKDEEFFEQQLYDMLDKLLIFPFWCQLLGKKQTLKDMFETLCHHVADVTRIEYYSSCFVPEQKDEDMTSSSHDFVMSAATAYVPDEAASAAMASSSAAVAALHEPSPSAVQAVRELFPDLGIGFVQECLKVCQTSEELINLLLEDNLPPSVAGLPRDLEASLPSAEASTPAPRVVAHRGKRDKAVDRGVDAKERQRLLDNYSMVEERVPKTSVQLGVAEAGADALMYEDEYDDTYDDLGDEGALEPTLEDELDLEFGRNSNRPGRQSASQGEQGEGEDEDTGDDGASSAASSSQPSRGRGSGRGRGGRGSGRGTGGPPIGNVEAARGRGGRNTGGPAARGRGAVSQVWLNRRKKDSNKAKYANHNRKAQALKKNAKSGAMPSN